MTTRSRLVFRLVVPTGVANTTSTIYVTTRGFRTAASDTPASTYIQERVAKAGGFSRSLYSGGTLGGVIKPNYGVLVLNNEDGALDGIASYAGGGGTVTCWWGEDGAAFPAGYTQVYQATIASVLVDMATVTIRQQDRMEALSRPIVTATFAGSGGIEGTDVAARKKPLVFGTPGLVPLVLLDKASQVYYVQANATDSDTARGLSEFGQVFEGGVPIDRVSSNYPFKDYLFMAVHAPGPGEFRMWTGYDTRFASQAAANIYTKGPILVRLGGVPVGELRFGAVGRLQNTGGGSPREWRFSDLCNRAGLNDVESDTMAVMQGVRADFTVGNRYTEADQTYLQVMTDRCQALLGACGFNRLDEFFCLTLLDPEDGADSSVYTFTADNSTGFTRLPVPGMERPVWQVNVKAGRAWPCTVFSGASAEMQDLLTREGHYVSFRGYSSNTRKKYPNAISVDIEIDGHDFPDVPSQRAFVDRFGALFGTRRDLMQLRCLDFSASTLTLELHDKVTLTLDRLGYDAGELMRIVGIELDLDAQQIKIMLWGTNSGFSGWATTGGAFPADAGEPGGSWGSEDPPPDVVTETTVQLGLNDLMGNFTGLIVGGPIVEPLAADADSNAAAMGEFTGVIYGELIDEVAGAWNTTNNTGTWAFSNSDFTADWVSGAGVTNVQAIAGRSSGKRYFEVYIDAVPTVYGTGVRHDIGVTRVTPPSSGGSDVAGGASASFNGACYRIGGAIFVNGSNVGAVTSLAATDVVGVALDLATGNVWFSLNGVYTQGDPAAGSSPEGTVSTGATYYPGIAAESLADMTVTLRTKASDMTYSPPTGFTSWALL